MLIRLFIPFLLLVGCTASRVYTSVPDSELAFEISPQPEPTTAYEGEPKAEQVAIRIQFAGDILLHQGPIEAARTSEHTFDFRPFLRDIKPFLAGDLSIANLETPIDVLGGNEDITAYPRFNAPFEILEALKDAGFNHLMTANNHAFDRGIDGLIATVAHLERIGLTHTGMNIDEEAFNTPTILDVNGIQVGMLAYTHSVNGLESLIPEEMRPFALRQFRSYTMGDVPMMAEDIINLREAGAQLIIVSLHWGEEYVDTPTQMQQLIASELSEAGADVIMGHHPHVIQPIEWYYRSDGSRSLIIYSLGNFLADQTRLVTPIERTQYGMLVNLDIVKEHSGEIRLVMAEVLPTLCMRDFDGTVLGAVDFVSVLPIFDGELPAFITDNEVRTWGRSAYEHVVNIVGEQFIARHATD